MIFEDRVSTYPNRYTMTNQNGGTSLVILERADEPVQVGTPLNADTFAAMMAELRAYAEANNLLDNSDFRNPVNQRGSNVYAGSSEYTIDRWKSASKLDVKVEDGGIRLTCASDATTRNGCGQSLAPEKTPAPGTVVTVAYEDEDGNVYVESGNMPRTSYLKLFSGSGIGVNLYSPDPYARLSFMVPPNESISLRWIALYEGEYTKETLPKHRPKGYAAELMECMRYYQIRSTNDVAAVDLRPTMRAVPTITKVASGYAYSADL